MYLTPEEYEEKWLAPMRREKQELQDELKKQEFAWIDERIKQFQEHCRRKEGQQVRWFMVRHNAALQADLAEFQWRLLNAMDHVFADMAEG